MTQTQPWYNAERVSQHHSVILTSWMAERNAQRAISAGLENGNKPLTGADLLAALGGTPSHSGKSVNERTAMSVSAVYASVALIAGAIASIPLPVYERTIDGRKRTDHEYWWLFNEQPHPDWDAATFWEFVTAGKLLYGDGYVRLVRPGFASNRIDWLEPLHPGYTQAFRTQSGELLYRATDPFTGEVKILPAADVLHFKSLGFDGLKSLSPIRHAAKQSVGMNMAATEFSAKFFANGARPDFALTMEGKLNEEQVNILRTTWAQRYGGSSNSHMPAILTGGLDVKELTMSAEDTQLIATLGFTIEDIARVYGVPPHMIAHTEKTTSWGTGIEQMGIGFVKYTLMRHLIKYEQEINRKLWPSRAKYFVKHNTAGLERGDYKSRNEGYRIAAGRAGEPGWMTVNEIRRLEDMPPIDGGDELNNGSTQNAQAAAAA